LVEQTDRDAPRSELERRLEILDEPRAIVRAQHEPVLNDLDAVAAPLGDPRITLPCEIGLDLFRAEVLRHADRERHRDPRRLAPRNEAPLELFANRLRRIAPHGLSAALAVERRRAREQELQMVV